MDSTCINCDTCRQLAPFIFGEADDYSFVQAQPSSEGAKRAATRALLACPTGSIGTIGDNRAQEVMQDFPLLIDDNVFYCGFCSPKSFGGSSYLIKRKAGNWLVDSPKFLPHLIKQFSEMGGISKIFLTHSDDVAEANRWAQEFNAERIIHRNELRAQPDAEIVIDGDGVREFDGGAFKVIPTPGHTSGHCVLLHEGKFLFTGDHLAWDRDGKSLTAYRDFCWHSWAKQTESMKRLAQHDFEWVLPGHGDRCQLSPSEMRSQMTSLISWMETV